MAKPEPIDLIGNRATRSPYEVMFKRLATVTTTAIAAGHLTTLRHISRKDRADAILAVVGFLLVPTLPFATLILHSWGSFRLLCLRERENFDAVYYLSAALGVRATVLGAEEDAAESVALVDVEYEDLIRCRREYDSRWIGRLAVLILFAAQVMMTVVLVERRLQFGGNAAASWDAYSGLIAEGATATVISSIGITLLNTS